MAKRCVKRWRFCLSQVSMEYLILVGFVLASIVPLFAVYYTFSQQSGEEITASQLSRIGKEVVDAAESVYYLGSPSQRTFMMYFPGRVDSSSIAQNEVRFMMMTENGPVEISEHSGVNITGSLPSAPGTYRVTVTALGTYVNVTYR